MRRSLGFLLTLSLIGACAGAAPPATSEPVASTTAPQVLAINHEVELPRGETVALEPVGDCDVLLDYFIDQALDQVGPWGLDGYGYEEIRWVADTGSMAADEAGDGGGPAPEPSSTNVQVEGVDEGDIVKASGDHLYVIGNGRLHVFSTAGEAIEQVGKLDFWNGSAPSQMLLEGDRLVVVGSGNAGFRPLDGALSVVDPHSLLTEITLVDVSDPSQPTRIRRLTVDGSLVTTRLVGDHLRVVLEARPVGLEWAQPTGSGLRAENRALEENREIIRNSTIENWLPYYVTDADDEGTLVDCRDVLLPPEPSGLGTLSILDFDLGEGIDDWTAASVVASGSTVYANTERTYVATSQWLDPSPIDTRPVFTGHVTRIHRFDTPADGDMRYVASGDVDGFLLNQFAMDEHEGHLRIATTTEPESFRAEGGDGASESSVTVMATAGDKLNVVGRVDGLGVTELIRSVRFMGEVGYVVTFRQTDPLYVLDLSQPTQPVVTGELKIPGYSAYLHPVGESLLLGVGQDADPDTGRVRGLQLSLFDVTDPTTPARVDTLGIGALDGDESQVYSPVESDHKAFTLAADHGYVPYQGSAWSNETGVETARIGVLAVDWSDGTLAGTRDLTISQGKGELQWQYAPQRTVAQGDTLFAIGHGGISVIDLPSGEVTHQIRY